MAGTGGPARRELTTIARLLYSSTYGRVVLRGSLDRGTDSGARA